jgi:hypothetical protein
MSAQCYDVTVYRFAPRVLIRVTASLCIRSPLHNSTYLAPVIRPSCCSFRGFLFWYSSSVQESQLVSTGSGNVELLRRLLGVKLHVTSQIFFALGKTLMFVALLTQQFCPEHYYVWEHTKITIFCHVRKHAHAHVYIYIYIYIYICQHFRETCFTQITIF